MRLYPPSKFVFGAALCVVCLWSPIAAQAQGQFSPAELLPRYQQEMDRLKPILQTKVLPAVSNLASTDVAVLSTDDLKQFLVVIKGAVFLRSHLSSEEEPSYAAPAAAAPVMQCQPVWRCVCVTNRRGRARWVWQCQYEWVPNPHMPPPAAAPASASRQPLRENTEALEEYFRDRIDGTIAADAVKDRTAALQLLGVMMNLDPVFKPGKTAVPSGTP